MPNKRKSPGRKKSKRMSFLSGSPWQQPGIISTGNSFGQPSTGQQQQQNKPQTTLPGASVPGALGSPALSTSSPAPNLHGERPCHGQMPVAGSRKSLLDDEVKLACSRTEGTLPGVMAEAPASGGFRMPLLRVEDDGFGAGRPREDGAGLAGAGIALGSAGQSPSSPLSSRSSPPSSLPSPSISPGRCFPNTTPDHKPRSDIGSQLKPENKKMQEKHSGIKHGLYIQESRMTTQDVEKDAVGSSFPGMLRTGSGHREDEIKSGKPPSRELLTSSKEIPEKILPGNPILLLPSEKQGAVKATVAACPTAYLTAGPHAGLPPGVTVADNGEREVGGENLIKNRKTGPCFPPSRDTTGGFAQHEQPWDAGCVRDATVGASANSNRETKTRPSSDLPQRTTVRRAMSDCSHLSVPTIMGGAYPTGMVGSSLTPNMPDFALVGIACPPRASYPHAAVRRSLTVTEGTDAAATMATLMSSPLMTSPVLPSSPPPKRHHGSCETNLLFPVPPPVGASVNSTRDSTLNVTGKTIVSCVYWIGLSVK